MPGEIHDEHPFLDAEEHRDPVRRFRGRLAAPVTVVTSGDDDRRTGLTVSSLVVADNDRLHFVLGPESYLWDAIRESNRFVVHVLDGSQRSVADRFAGIRPSPGGPFSGLAVTQSDHGPTLDDCPNRAFCGFESVVTGDGYLLVEGRVARTELADLVDPLQWFRGSYRRLASD
jgi:3-hydroxy-9,10-secoandrosta-1,3,5(10)-triene-9,17-dione monooxygenase reductase component